MEKSKNMFLAYCKY